MRVPDQKEVEAAVIELYKMGSRMVGGGGCAVHSVEVLECYPNNPEGIYLISVVVKGWRHFPVIAVRRPEEMFEEIRNLELWWESDGVCKVGERGVGWRGMELG